MNDWTQKLLEAQVEVSRAANNLDNSFVVDLVDGVCVSDVDFYLCELKAAIYNLEQAMKNEN